MRELSCDFQQNPDQPKPISLSMHYRAFYCWNNFLGLRRNIFKLCWLLVVGWPVEILPCHNENSWYRICHQWRESWHHYNSRSLLQLINPEAAMSTSLNYNDTVFVFFIFILGGPSIDIFHINEALQPLWTVYTRNGIYIKCNASFNASIACSCDVISTKIFSLNK